MSVNKPLKVYRGEHFGYAGEYEMPPGTWTATAQLKKVADNSLVQLLDVQILPPVSPSVLSVITIKATDEQTLLWPIETLKFDIRFEESGGDAFYIPDADNGPVYVRVNQAVTYV